MRRMDGKMSDVQVFDTPDKIEAFRLLSIRGRLQLELKGIKFKGSKSTFSYVKQEFGFKGQNVKVFEQYEAMLRERGILQ
jgi:hypothetical protein